jgi:16S rRNA (guanine(966)-N(2))-methyltransferase RsmD
MRIIAGRYRSRRLKVGPPPGTRPTGDKLRETLFNILADRIIESRFLDAYAGVGAIGIEAFSRGARVVAFVDHSRKACAAIRVNLAGLGVAQEYHVLQMDLARAMDGPQAGGFDVAFLDPPYARDDLHRRDLERFGEGSLLAEDGVLVIEHARSMILPDQAGCLDRVRTHLQGDSALTFYEGSR